MSEPLYRGEALLVRWADSSRGGRTITLQIDGDGPHQFRGYEGERFAIMVVPIGNDEKPLKKVSADNGDGPTREGGQTGTKADYSTVNPSPPSPPTKSKGRKWNDMPLSARAAMLTKDPVFWSFLEDRKFAAVPCDELGADAALKHFCCTHSKAEIKLGRFIGDRYLELESNFIAWKQAVQHGAI